MGPGQVSELPAPELPSVQTTALSSSPALSQLGTIHFPSGLQFLHLENTGLGWDGLQRSFELPDSAVWAEPSHARPPQEQGAPLSGGGPMRRMRMR